MKTFKTTIGLEIHAGYNAIAVRDGAKMYELFEKAFEIPNDGSTINARLTIFKKGKIIIEKVK